jgi:hypothetical protein
MPGLTLDNCTAFDIIDDLGNELDITWKATEIKWKAYFTQRAYDKVKSERGDYFYMKDGQEYVKVFDNHRIPFIIHMRVAGMDNTIPEEMPYALGCRREIDED